MNLLYIHCCVHLNKCEDAARVPLGERAFNVHKTKTSASTSHPLEYEPSVSERGFEQRDAVQR